ncbi:NADH dehydrogenase subunit A [Geoalkalibacter ferrihydriticus]|uniref:NADH-quinone oxidoreductase subunit A n=1 Tax=Geoalkalibacter ferrihydriticus TaxID=392333 RepID=A0A1G9T7M2_9BACT|nr:NADH-quinone oxidoreductase subunit A [Geoalkalibacter ferrihydriticus]SDM43622.1 NADH dehydrogenase subunit A [Geoalkalibacter ferrihydriticus]
MPLILAASAVALSPPTGDLPPAAESLAALGLYALLAVLLVAFLMGLSWLLGHRTHSSLKQAPYESGVAPTGGAYLRAPAPFFLVAIFFIIFAVDAVFILSWAVAWDILGWAGLAQVGFFIAIVLLGLVHLWKTGGLDWHPSAQGRMRGRGGGE